MTPRSLPLPSLLAATALVLGSGIPGQDAVGPCTVRAIGGEVHRGAVEVRDGRVLLSTGGTRQELELAGVRSIVFDDRRTVTAADSVGHLWLRSGWDVPLTSLGGGERRFEIRSPVFEDPVDVSLRHVRAFRVPRDEVHDARGFRRALAEPHATSDYLFVVDEEGGVRRLRATLLGLTPEGVAIEYRGEERPPVPFARVYGVVLAEASGIVPDPLPRPRVLLRLTTGREIPGKLRSLDAGSAVLAFDEGVEARIAPGTLRAIEVRSDKLVYLSSLEPAEEHQVPALDRTWPWLADRSPTGETLKLGGREYGRGLVLFPRTRLTYALDGGFDRFRATIGMEDGAGPQAHAIFRVLADGEVVYESDPFTRATPPEALEIPVEGVDRLALETDFGKNLDLGDHCVFAEARLIVE